VGWLFYEPPYDEKDKKDSRLMKLFANGCSFTIGENLVPPQLIGHRDPIIRESAIQERLSKAWPNRLGELLNADQVVNLGIGCGSNARIVRTTLDWCLSQNQQDLSEWTAIIQWTHPSRYEYYIPKLGNRKDYRQHESGPETLDIDPDRWGKVKAGVRTGIENESLKVGSFDLDELVQLPYLLWTPQQGVYENLEHYNAIVSIFNQFQIRYFFWHLLGYYSSPQLDSYIKENFNWIDKTNPNAMCDWERIPNDGHPSELGHSQISQWIYDLIAQRI
jgi:hypothetical protein